MLNESKILVTGGAGFIGSNLVDSLVGSGCQVVVIDNLSTGKKENLNKVINNIVFIENDLESHDLTQFKDIDAVIHLAAQASVPLSVEYFGMSSTTNMLGTINVIEFCRLYNIPLVYASSSAVYGGIEVGNDASTQVNLLSPYSVDKYAMEMYATVANEIYGLSCIGLRFFNVYGPRQDPSNPYSGVISIFVDRLLKGESITINGGYQTRDFIYVTDVVKVIEQSLSIVSKTCIGDQVNILTATSISIDRLAEILIDEIGIDVEKCYKKLAIGDPIQSNGTSSKMRNLYKIDPKNLTPLTVGLKETINFIKNEGS